jgi:hypothetical protein
MQRFAVTENSSVSAREKRYKVAQKKRAKNKMLVNTVHVLLYSKLFKGQSQLFKIPSYLGMLDRDPESMGDDSKPDLSGSEF